MTPYAFFYKWAEWSYTPGEETAKQGRARGAKLLARAERRASEEGWTFQWERDTITNGFFEETDDPYYLWFCVARDGAGQVMESLGGVDFGRGKEPWGDPCARVVQAELAAEGVRAHVKATRKEQS